MSCSATHSQRVNRDRSNVNLRVIVGSHKA